MATQEERIARLEDITSEYRPILADFAYELTLVKGLIVDQTRITQDLRRDSTEIKGRLSNVENRLSNMEEQLHQILLLLRPTRQ